jgi:hypothetical protein
VKNLDVSWARWVLVAALVVGCERDAVVAPRDGGVDAGCSDEQPDDGVVVLTRRGCPLTIDYAIH